MNALRLWWTHVVMGTIELVRLPAYAVPTLLFPLLLYSFFGLPYGRDEESARALMGSYGAYAVVGVGLFQFGVGIAVERGSSWEVFLRVLPVSPFIRLAARVASAVMFGAVTAAAVIVVAALCSKAHPDAAMIVRLFAALLAGSIPFALFGIAIGYWVNAKAAVPVANVLYLPLALAGGMWVPPQFLPSYIAAISPYVPTRGFAELVWAAVLRTPVPIAYVVELLLYTTLFAVLAVWGYRRDEGQRYA
jgi:ABC-2 type transport system permease protein